MPYSVQTQCHSAYSSHKVESGIATHHLAPLHTVSPRSTWVYSTMHGILTTPAPQGNRITSQYKGPKHLQLCPQSPRIDTQDPEHSNTTCNHRLIPQSADTAHNANVCLRCPHSHQNIWRQLTAHRPPHSPQPCLPTCLSKYGHSRQPTGSPHNVQSDDAMPRYAPQGPVYRAAHTLITQHGPASTPSVNPNRAQVTPSMPGPAS